MSYKFRYVILARSSMPCESWLTECFCFKQEWKSYLLNMQCIGTEEKLKGLHLLLANAMQRFEVQSLLHVFFSFHSFIYSFSSTVKHLLGHISSPWSKERVERLLNRTRAERGWHFLERLEIWLALDRMINIKPTFCHDGVKTAKSWKCDGWIMRRVIKGLSHMLLVLICFV